MLVYHREAIVTGLDSRPFVAKAGEELGVAGLVEVVVFLAFCF